jgi:hypothetical protein
MPLQLTGHEPCRREYAQQGSRPQLNAGRYTNFEDDT